MGQSRCECGARASTIGSLPGLRGVSAFRRGGRRRTNPIAGPPSSSESLKEVQERLLPLWQEEIAADLEEGRSVLVVSHGNTIRVLVKHIEGISDLDIEDLAVHNADPLLYELDGRLRPAERIVLGNNDM